MAQLTKLKLSIMTGSEPFSGTDARIYLAFCGRGTGRIYEVPTHSGDLEIGKLDIYEVAIPDGPELTELTGLLLLNGMNGTSPSWRVLWVRLVAVDADGQSWELADAMLERWLETAAGKAPAAFIPLHQPLKRRDGQDEVGCPTSALVPVP